MMTDPLRNRPEQNNDSTVPTPHLALSKAVEQSPSSIMISDVEGKIEYVNPKFTHLTGYTLAEIKGQTPRILKSGHTSPEEYAELWRTITSGGEWRGEFLNRKKNGELYWEQASISPVFDDDDRITHFVAVKEDISDRKQAESDLAKLNQELEARVQERTAQLQSANQRITAVLDSASDAILLIDTQDRIDLFNPAFSRMFGYQDDEIHGAEASFGMSPEHVQEFLFALRRTRANRSAEYLEARARRKNGTVFDVSCAFGAVMHNGHVVCNIHDITLIKEAERLKDRFVSMVNHELRTPLSAIVVITETLSTYYERLSDDRRISKIQQIVEQTRIMSELVEGVLDMRRLALQRTQRSFPALDMCAEARRTIADLQTTAQNKRQEVLLLGSDLQGCIVRQDATDMRQVWRNLIGNAIKYTPEDGHVMVRVGRVKIDAAGVPEDALESSFDVPAGLAQGSYVFGQVEDDGHGIPAENQQQLFERFYRGWATASHIPGTGLGLALVKEILDQCQGGITVRSELGRGSRFTFFVPMGKTDEAAKHPASDEDAES